MKSKKIVKLVYGIDISMEDFTVMSGVFYNNTEREVTGCKKFKNNLAGFERLLLHCQKQQSKCNTEENTPVWFVMESTGIYYENLAYFLSDRGLNVHVALPNKIKNFIRTLEIKSKTDNLDARAITLYGLEKQVGKWKVPDERTKLLKELNRELVSAKEISALIKNQLHAKQKHTKQTGKH